MLEDFEAENQAIVTIFDLAGNQLFKAPIWTNGNGGFEGNFTLLDVENGIYLLKVTMAGREVTRRLLISR